MPAAIPPTLRVYSRLADILLDTPTWVAAAGGLDRIVRFDQTTEDARPYREDYSAYGDTPMTVISMGRKTKAPYTHDSATYRQLVDYDIVMVGPNMLLGPIEALDWATDQALVIAGPYLGLNPLITNPVEVTSSRNDGFSKDQWKKGAERWNVVSTIRVELMIDREDVVNGDYPMATGEPNEYGPTT